MPFSLIIECPEFVLLRERGMMFENLRDIALICNKREVIRALVQTA